MLHSRRSARQLPVVDWSRPARFIAALAAFSLTLTLQFIGLPVVAQAAEPLRCVAGTIFGIDNGNITAINTATAASTTLVATLSGAGNPNALAILRNGTGAVYVDNAGASAGSRTEIYVYTAASGSTVTASGAPLLNSLSGFVRGGLDLSTNIFYYGGSRTSNPAINDFYAYNVATNTAIGYVGSVTSTSATGGSNGDLAFDANGNMLVVIADGGSNNFLYRVTGVPSTAQANNTNLTASVLATLPNNVAGNGITFDGDGYLYVSAGGTAASNVLYKLDPTNGNVQSGYPKSISTPSGFIRDLADCDNPGTIQLRKNIVGRYASNDQFGLTITANPAPDAGNTGTATGTDTGLQTGTGEIAGPILGVPGRVYTLIETGANGASLANYVSKTISCVDTTNDDQPITATSAGTGQWTLTFPSSAAAGGVLANIVCTVTNLPAPQLTLRKNVAGRYVAGDQFALAITGPGVTSGNTGTTTGGDTGLQTSASEIAGPVRVTSGSTYTVTEAGASGADLGDYTRSITCTDTATDTALTTTPTGTAGEYTVDVPSTPADGPAPVLVCTMTNTPNFGRLQLQKDIVSRYAPGDQFELAVTGPGVSSGNTGTTTGSDTGRQDSAAEIAGPVNALAGRTYTLTESGANGADLARYGRSISCVDQANGDEPVATSSLGNGAYTLVFPDAPAGGELPDVVCVITNTALQAALVVTKTVDPTSGTRVDEGTVLTYTLTFDNSAGQAPATVDYTDVLTKVLDDATVTSTPVSADPDLHVGAIANDRFRVTGSVAAGITSTVTFSVTVDDPDTGDHRLDNFLVPTGDTPPETCTETDTRCTTNGVPALLVAKSVTPASGTTVQPGDVLTYTLTFDNTDGQAAADVDFTDQLQKVLDDATVITEPALTGGTGLTVGPRTPDTFRVAGSIAAGAVSTVTYAVRVDDPDSGDHRLDNFLVPTGDEPPANCVTGNVLCTTNPVPALVVTKSVDPASGTTVQEGDVLTYTVTFDNAEGQAAAAVDYTDVLTKVLDDGTVTADPVASDPDLTVSAIANGRFRVSGSVAAGQTTTVVYEVTVNTPDTGDHRLDNFVVPTGENPPESCLADDPTCTSNPVPALVVTKAVDPTSGTTVQEGDVLTYTLTFDNAKGQAPANVDYTDELAGVLDDAAVTTPPAASAPGLTVGPLAAGSFTVTGAVPAGQTITVTYRVTVDRPDDGDHRLDNFLVPTGQNPPERCVSDDPLCTTNPVPALVVTKSVDPDSGTRVAEGEVLIYTLTFDNADGQAAAAVDYTDELARVLDDATVTTGATASDPALTVGPLIGTAFRITGSVAAGETATVVYEVTVNHPDTGDHRLDNFLVPTGENPPDSCVDDDPTCTTNPVPALVVTKAVDPESGTTVREGDVLTYTLTFDNAKGQASADVDYTDELARLLDDAAVTTAPSASAPGLTVSAVAGGSFTVTGAVPAGQTITVTYRVTVDSPDTGDHRLDNFLVPTGENPPDSCVDDDPTCTTNPVPALVVTKAVDPKSGSTVQPGDVLTYTLTFDNTDGQAAAPVDYTDELAKVLDDATLTTGATASDPALTVGPLTGTAFRVTGSVAAGETATVTYAVTVNTPDTGDHRLDNFLVPTGENPPDSCVDEDPRCTSNPVPGLSVRKTADPVSRTTVREGQVITYTLTFDNRTGRAAADVDYTDDLTDVLDDARVTTAPSLATGPGLAVSPIADGTFTVRGSLAAGATASVIYRVEVDRPDRGNRRLDNYLVPTGVVPPTSCLTTDPLCTHHPVPPRDISPVTEPRLPNTGSPVSMPLLFGALAALVAGAGLIVIGRRRSRRS